jgi:hypothetical protein
MLQLRSAVHGEPNEHSMKLSSVAQCTSPLSPGSAPLCTLQPELPQSCTPAAARAAATAHADRTPILQRETQLVPLLAYCLADVDLSAAAAACQQLLRLRLLPLADGSLAAVSEYSGERSKGQGRQQQQQLVFVVTEELELLLVGSQSEWA